MSPTPHIRLSDRPVLPGASSRRSELIPNLPHSPEIRGKALRDRSATKRTQQTRSERKAQSGVTLSHVGLFQPGLSSQTNRHLRDPLDFKLPEVGGGKCVFPASLPNPWAGTAGPRHCRVDEQRGGGGETEASVERVTCLRFSLRNSFPLRCPELRTRWVQ